MKQSQLPGKFLIPGLFMLFLALAGSAQAAPSVDLSLSPSHNPLFASGQLPSYAFGEPVDVQVTLTNQGPDPITIMGFPPKRGISNRNQTDFLAFPRSPDTAVILPGHNLTFDFAWDQKDAKGMQVDSGLYTIAVYYLLSENPDGDLDFTHVEPYSRSVDIVILPKGGALMADIRVNQTQVVDNVSVTLESIHLTNTTGDVFFTFQVPEEIPFWTHPSGWKRCYLDFVSIEGEFSIDHNTPRQFFYHDVSCEPPHLFQSMYKMDPIPADAQEMEINLTVSGSHQGSSIFRVNLTPYSAVSGNGTGTPTPQSAPLSTLIPVIALCCISLITIRQNRPGDR